jgi:K+-sensing histidine kinase KdpD
MNIAFGIGLIFSPIAALMSGLIAYEEYSHHFSTGKQPLKLALEAALITFVVFILISFFIGITLPHIFGG